MQDDDSVSDRDAVSAADESLPAPPEIPNAADCCGGGCSPCIFDAYEEALVRWKREVAAIKARRQVASVKDSPE